MFQHLHHFKYSLRLGWSWSSSCSIIIIMYEVTTHWGWAVDMRHYSVFVKILKCICPNHNMYLYMNEGTTHWGWAVDMMSCAHNSSHRLAPSSHLLPQPSLLLFFQPLNITHHENESSRAGQQVPILWTECVQALNHNSTCPHLYLYLYLYFCLTKCVQTLNHNSTRPQKLPN